MRATGAPGWKLDHWESRTRQRDGGMTSRVGPMPDGRVYLNGFGYSDTGGLETVTAVFTEARDGIDDLTEDRRVDGGGASPSVGTGVGSGG